MTLLKLSPTRLLLLLSLTLTCSTQVAAAESKLITSWNPGGNSGNFGGVVGTYFQVGSANISVNALGVYVANTSGWYDSHLVRIYDESDVKVAEVTLSLVGASVGEKFVNLATPVTLTANQRYYLLFNVIYDSVYDFASAASSGVTGDVTIIDQVEIASGWTGARYKWIADQGFQPASVYTNGTLAGVTLKYTVSGGDTIQPTVAITMPTAGQTVSGSSVTISADASDNVGVVGVQFMLDGEPLGAEDTSHPYSITWDSTTVSNGSRSITAVARDAAGNTKTSTAVAVNVVNATAKLITSWNPGGTSGNFGGVVGTYFQVGSANISVNALGVYVANTSGYDSHFVRIYDESDVKVAEVTLSLVGASVGEKFVNLATPVTLTANQRYYLLFYVGYDSVYDFASAASNGVSGDVTIIDQVEIASGWTGARYKWIADQGFPASVYTNGTLAGVTLKYTVSGGDTIQPTVAITMPTAGQTVSGSSVTISADASDNVGVAGVQFKLDGVSLGAEDTSHPYSTTWDFTTVANGSRSITAVARDAAGNTATSATVQVTVSNSPSNQPQTISFPPIANRVFGDPAFSLSATASSGLPVTYTVTAGSAQVTGSTVTLHGAGSVTITASQSGNSVFAAATTVAQTFTVNPASQSIVFSDLTDKVMGADPFSVSANATSLLPVSFTFVSGPASIAGNVITVSGTVTGTVTIRASQAGDSRFEAAPPVERSFNVTAVPVAYMLEVQNGTGSTVSGVYGDPRFISAIVPSGQHFTGWKRLSGDAYIYNIASQDTVVELRSMPTVLQATFSASPPTYLANWNQINFPPEITAGDGQFGSYVPVRFTATVTNAGTGAWSRFAVIELLDSSNYVVGFGPFPFPSAGGGVAAGGTGVAEIPFFAPNTPSSQLYTLRIRENSTTVAGSQVQLTLTILPRTGNPPVLSQPQGILTGTLSVPFTPVSLSATNSPTFDVNGMLPPGVTLTNGQFIGTPTAAGEYGVTVTASNGSGVDVKTALFLIHPNTSYSFSVTDGTVSTASGQSSSAMLTVGSLVTITASTPPVGHFFNGWEKLSGSESITDKGSATTTFRLESAAPTSIRANFSTGKLLYVERGESTPLGGLAGAAIALAPDDDGNGTMFDRWATFSGGTIDDVNAKSATYTMPGNPALVTAHFVPGYRLQMNNGLAGAAGGLPGTSIPIWPSASAGSGYQFEGFALEGPGYLNGYGGTMNMGNGAGRLLAGWWPTSSPLTRTLVWSPNAAFFVMMNEPITMNIATDFSGSSTPVTRQQLHYSRDGGITWELAKEAFWSNTLEGNYAYQSQWTASFQTAGLVVVRGKAEAANQQNPICFYMPLRVLNQTAATILTHPVSLTVTAGQKAAFSFVASGNGSASGNVAYRWKKNGTEIDGANGFADGGALKLHEIPVTEMSHSGTYTVEIQSGLAGTWVPSLPATLTVLCNPPTILSQPSSVAIAPGNNATFTVDVGGTTAYAFQWRKDGTSIAGATSNTLIIAAVQSADNGNYTVTITSLFGCGTTISDVATLTVTTSAPSITSHPVSTSVTAGGTTGFTVVATGSGLSYRWRRNGVELSDGGGVSGAASSTLTISGATAANAGNYDVRVSNTAGDTYSNVATLTVNPPTSTNNGLNIHIPLP